MDITEQVNEIKKDVLQIKHALIGNEFSKETSFLQRIKNVETKVNDIEKFKMKIIYSVFGGSFVISILFNLFIEIFKK